jgi:hypothetical protein
MDDVEDLARRYLALWAENFKTLLADPRAMEMVKRWISFTGQFSYPASGTTREEGAPPPAWPPFFAPFGPPQPPTPDAPGGQSGGLVELERRVAELERQVAELVAMLEHPRKPRPARPGSRRGRN